MMAKKCVYTGLDATSKDPTIPKDLLRDEIHNWNLNVPCNTEYRNKKANQFPTELEMQANEIFHLLEMARLRVVYYEEKLKQIQELIGFKEKPKTNKQSENIKEKQIEQSIAEHNVLEDNSPKIDDFFESKKKLWD